MRALPLRARIYVAAVISAGVLACLVASRIPEPAPETRAWQLAFFMILAVLAGSRKVKLMRYRVVEDAGSMTLGYAITVAALIRFGPSAGLVVGALSTLSGCLYPRVQPAHQLLFNVSLTALSAWIAGLCYLRVNGGLDVQGTHSFPAVIALATVYFLVNTYGVSTAIGLWTNRKRIEVWNETFLWTAPTYFAGAAIVALAISLFGKHAGVILVFGAPVAYLTYQSYASYTARTEEKLRHIEELRLSHMQLADLYLATIKSLALAIDAKDQYTHEHILRVQRYAVRTAEELGITGSELDGLRTGALLHDIGKLGVPEYVLLKPGRLTDEEFAKIKKHPEIGAAILEPVGFPWPVLPVVKYHHEKWDGTGYPEGLKGEEIPLTARVMAVADVYDALTSNRSYRNAWPHERAISEIQKSAGKHFDPRVVDAFVSVIDAVLADIGQEQDEGDTAEHASSSCVRAVDAARDIRQASSELWALYEVAQTLSASLGLQETLDILGGKLEAILPGTACLFLLRGADDKTLRVRTAVGVNREFFADAPVQALAGPTAVVAETMVTYLGPYEPEDLAVNSQAFTPWISLHSALIVPVVHEGHALGTINLYHPGRNAFNGHDRQLLEAIAARAALAIYNGILFDRTRTNADTDGLTGLFNVRFFTEMVEERCARDPQQEDRYALLCLDLDSFKPINDNFGHQKGDQVLRDLSGLFRKTVRDPDVVARYGGDEFLVLLEGADAVAAATTAVRIQEAVRHYDAGLVHPRLGTLRLGVSVGYACYPVDGTDCAALLSTADARMYADKMERKLQRLAEHGSTEDQIPPTHGITEIRRSA